MLSGDAQVKEATSDGNEQKNPNNSIIPNPVPFNPQIPSENLSENQQTAPYTPKTHPIPILLPPKKRFAFQNQTFALYNSPSININQNSVGKDQNSNQLNQTKQFGQNFDFKSTFEKTIKNQNETDPTSSEETSPHSDQKNLINPVQGTAISVNQQFIPQKPSINQQANKMETNYKQQPAIPQSINISSLPNQQNNEKNPKFQFYSNIQKQFKINQINQNQQPKISVNQYIPPPPPQTQSTAQTNQRNIPSQQQFPNMGNQQQNPFYIRPIAQIIMESQQQQMSATKQVQSQPKQTLQQPNEPKDNTQLSTPKTNQGMNPINLPFPSQQLQPQVNVFYNNNQNKPSPMMNQQNYQNIQFLTQPMGIQPQQQTSIQKTPFKRIQVQQNQPQVGNANQTAYPRPNYNDILTNFLAYFESNSNARKTTQIPYQNQLLTNQNKSQPFHPFQRNYQSSLTQQPTQTSNLSIPTAQKPLFPIPQNVSVSETQSFRITKKDLKAVQKKVKKEKAPKPEKKPPKPKPKLRAKSEIPQQQQQDDTNQPIKKRFKKVSAPVYKGSPYGPYSDDDQSSYGPTHDDEAFTPQPYSLRKQNKLKDGKPKKHRKPKYGRSIYRSISDYNDDDGRLRFEKIVVERRAAQGLLPNVEDPERGLPFTLSKLKSSQYFTFSDGMLSIEINGGYRLCRSTRGFRMPGKYFWQFKYQIVGEVTEEDENYQPHVRAGISTLKAKTEFPCGVDDRGYSVRNSGGKFHESREYDCDFTFQDGDTVGMGYLVDENTGEGSLHMWINFEYCGLLFDGIDTSKRWFPSFSIYKNAKITVDFSPRDVPDGWIAAARTPDDTPKKEIKASELLKAMREYPNVTPNHDIMKAIYVALTPKEDMPY